MTRSSVVVTATERLAQLVKAGLESTFAGYTYRVEPTGPMNCLVVMSGDWWESDGEDPRHRPGRPRPGLRFTDQTRGNIRMWALGFLAALRDHGST